MVRTYLGECLHWKSYLDSELKVVDLVVKDIRSCLGMRLITTMIDALPSQHPEEVLAGHGRHSRLRGVGGGRSNLGASTIGHPLTDRW